MLETRLVYCRDDRRRRHEGAPAVALESRNDSALYDPDTIETLLDALLAHPGAWTRFYRSTDLEQVADAIRRAP